MVSMIVPDELATPPVFVLSLDCEGKWGFLGTNSRRDDLTTTRLTDVYGRLLELLRKHDIRATFAFVGAFIMSAEEYHRHPDWFRDVTIEGRSWLRHFLDDAAKDSFDGWFAPHLLDLVKQEGRHEIASHSFRHILLAEHLVSAQEFENEMQAVRRVGELKQVNFSTFVYPRNQVGYARELSRHGFVGYRSQLRDNTGPRQRLISLLSEFNPRLRSQPRVQRNGVTPIPAGYFLNWRRGLRRLVPARLTRLRWCRALHDAIARRCVLHLWSHPHNFIDGQGMFPLLESILETIAECVARGEVVNLTQTQYCEQWHPVVASGTAEP